jgi:hypothetical protein
MGGGSHAGLLHHFLPEISVILESRRLISGTTQVMMDRGFISGTNWKWNLGVFAGLLRKE